MHCTSWSSTHCQTSNLESSKPNEFEENNFNTFPNEKILDVSKLKAFADDKLSIARMMISLIDRIENTVGKGENAGYQHFSYIYVVVCKCLQFGQFKNFVIW